MSKKEKPLPKPANTPFGRKRRFEEEEQKEPLMADRMALAMSAGKLDEFMKKELPDNEQARKLAEMMMGMTGMMPPGGFSSRPAGKHGEPSVKPEEPRPEQTASSLNPPEDVLNAVKSADVCGLTEILKREQKKRTPSNEAKAAPSENVATVDKKIIEELIKIASDNDLSLDWLFFRALKLYVQDYQKTGNL